VGVWRKTRARVGALLAIVAVLVVVLPSTARAGYRVPGIDVSKYQGQIRWEAVATTDVRFAILRATLGNRYRDEKYARNLAKATANGIAVGAYHFAKPGLAPWDARREADHFLAVARVGRGDLLPVLDIESSGGLSAQQLRTWATAWLARVEERTGVRPMIYSGNHFWRGSMRNTSWFGRRSHALWVAHWYVDAPSVPGRRWAGRGYTMWQWSASGRIAGIRGPVDQDRVSGSLANASIASVSVRYPGRGGMIRAPRLVCGQRRGRCFRLTNPGDRLTLEAEAAPGHRFVRWTGACEAAAEAPVCTVTTYRDKSLSAVFEREKVVAPAPEPAPSAPAGSASPAATGAPAPAPTTSSVTSSTPAPEPPPPPSTPAPAPPVPPAPTPTRVELACGGRADGCSTVAPAAAELPRRATTRDDDPDRTRFSWSSERDRRAIGRSYRWERRGSASISFGFRGGAVTLYTIEGPGMGKARVAIDGEAVGIVDGYARRFRTGIRHRFEGLDPGRHTLTITPLGRKRSSATGRRVVVDALRWGGHLRPDPRLGSASWATVDDPAASDGEIAVSDARGASARVPFSGTGLVLRAVRGPASGRARIWVDGRLVRTIDLFARQRRLSSIRVADDLRDGPHVARIVVLGRGNGRSGGAIVAIDRWVVPAPADEEGGAEDHDHVTHGRGARFSPSRTRP
jgi:GH25 family lysozyme M1 (1,4-beta-N-acetylmuramidase)